MARDALEDESACTNKAFTPEQQLRRQRRPGGPRRRLPARLGPGRGQHVDGGGQMARRHAQKLRSRAEGI